MKNLVIFKSFLGATKKYAAWIAEETGSELLDFGNAGRKILSNYDVITICSGTYVGWMPLVRFLRANWDILGDKKVVIVAVGAVPEKDIGSQKSYERIPDAIRKSAKYFKLISAIGPDREAVVKKNNIEPVVTYIKSL